MKFLELNKKRHATKHFTDKPVDPKDVRTAIEIATLAPSAHNSQPWKFVDLPNRIHHPRPQGHNHPNFLEHWL